MLSIEEAEWKVEWFYVNGDDNNYKYMHEYFQCMRTAYGMQLMRMRESARRQPLGKQVWMTDRLYSLEELYSQVGLPQVTVWCPRECLLRSQQCSSQQSHFLLLLFKRVLREKERDPKAQWTLLVRSDRCISNHTAIKCQNALLSETPSMLAAQFNSARLLAAKSGRWIYITLPLMGNFELIHTVHFAIGNVFVFLSIAKIMIKKTLCDDLL